MPRDIIQKFYFILWEFAKKGWHYREALREHYGERKWESLKELQAQRGKLTAEQDRLYAERERLKKQLKEVETVKGNVDRILGKSSQEIQRTTSI